MDMDDLQSQVVELQEEHRALDEKVRHLQQQPYVDQLNILRLKKRKLALKDAIEKLKSQMIPDLNA